MRIYRFDPVEKYEWAFPVNDDDFDVFNSFDGSPRANGWRSVPMKRITRDDRGRQFRPSDFPWLGYHAPLLRRRAAEALRDFLAPYGELLPLECAVAELYVLNVTRVIDGLDIEHSDAVTLPSTGTVAMIMRYVFRPEVVQGVHVFKIPQQPHAGTVYVDDEFVNLVKQSGLEGVGFKRLWSYEPERVQSLATSTSHPGAPAVRPPSRRRPLVLFRARRHGRLRCLYPEFVRAQAVGKQPAVVRVLQGRRGQTSVDMLQEWAAALQFPYDFGRKWNMGHNVAALEEHLIDLNWLPQTGFVFFVTDFDLVMRQHPRDRTAFLEILQRVASHWRNAPPGSTNGSGVPFTVVFQAESELTDFALSVLREAGAEPVEVRLPGQFGEKTE